MSQSFYANVPISAPTLHDLDDQLVSFNGFAWTQEAGVVVEQQSIQVTLTDVGELPGGRDLSLNG